MVFNWWPIFLAIAIAVALSAAFIYCVFWTQPRRDDTDRRTSRHARSYGGDDYTATKKKPANPAVRPASGQTVKRKKKLNNQMGQMTGILANDGGTTENNGPVGNDVVANANVKKKKKNSKTVSTADNNCKKNENETIASVDSTSEPSNADDERKGRPRRRKNQNKSLRIKNSSSESAAATGSNHPDRSSSSWSASDNIAEDRLSADESAGEWITKTSSGYVSISPINNSEVDRPKEETEQQKCQTKGLKQHLLTKAERRLAAQSKQPIEQKQQQKQQQKDQSSDQQPQKKQQQQQLPQQEQFQQLKIVEEAVKRARAEVGEEADIENRRLKNQHLQELTETREQLNRTVDQWRKQVEEEVAKRTALTERLRSAERETVVLKRHQVESQTSFNAVIADRDRQLDMLHAKHNALHEEVDKLRQNAGTGRDDEAVALRSESARLREDAYNLRQDVAELQEEKAKQAREHEVATKCLRAKHDVTAKGLRAGHETAVKSLRAEHEAVVKGLRAEHETAMKGLRAELDTARAETSRLRDEKINEAKMRADTLSKHESVVTSLRADRDVIVTDLQTKHESTMTSLRAEHAAVVKDLRAGHETVVKSLRAGHETAVKGLRVEHDTTVKGLLAEHETAMNGLRAELDAARAETCRLREKKIVLVANEAKLRVDHKAAIKDLQSKHESTMAGLRADHEAAVNDLKSKLELGMRAENDAVIKDLWTKHESAVTGLRAEHDAAVKRLRAEHAAASEVERAENERLRAEHEVALEVARTENKRLRGEHEAMLEAISQRLHENQSESGNVDHIADMKSLLTEHGEAIASLQDEEGRRDEASANEESPESMNCVPKQQQTSIKKHQQTSNADADSTAVDGEASKCLRLETENQKLHKEVKNYKQAITETQCILNRIIMYIDQEEMKWIQQVGDLQHKLEETHRQLDEARSQLSNQAEH